MAAATVATVWERRLVGLCSAWSSKRRAICGCCVEPGVTVMYGRGSAVNQVVVSPLKWLNGKIRGHFSSSLCVDVLTIYYCKT